MDVDEDKIDQAVPEVADKAPEAGSRGQGRQGRGSGISYDTPASNSRDQRYSELRQIC
jgi:hypothetical protein